MTDFSYGDCGRNVWKSIVSVKCKADAATPVRRLISPIVSDSSGA
ncbi:hypothetical protein [Leucobacter rhizosphaerae]|nr:hypothetical protein [Leucobacter rhizosphaerae]